MGLDFVNIIQRRSHGEYVGGPVTFFFYFLSLLLLTHPQTRKEEEEDDMKGL